MQIETLCQNKREYVSRTVSAYRSNHTSKSQNKEASKNRHVRNNSYIWRDAPLKYDNNRAASHVMRVTCALRQTLK
jgi:hypothetical protein